MTMRFKAGAGVAVASMLSCGGAFAAESTFATSSTSTSAELIFNAATTVTNQVSTYVTELLGRLNGAIVYDQTFALPFANATVQAGVPIANTAITTAGGPAVVIGTPHLLSSASTTTSASTSIYSLAGTVLSLPGFGGGTLQVGPNTVLTGAISSCEVAGLPSSIKPTCVTGGTLFNVVGGSFNINIETHTAYTIDTSTNTTNTTTLSEVYAIDGMTTAIGTAHNAVVSGGFDLNERFLRRMGDQSNWASQGSGYVTAVNGKGASLRSNVSAADPDLQSWLEAYGQWSNAGGQGTILGFNSSSYGLNGGMDYNLGQGVSVGLGLDHGWQTINVGSGAETGDLQLTQLGLIGGWRNGPWIANTAFTWA